MEFLIICPLALLAGFIDAIAGGGGLISLPAFILAGVPVHNALGTNKLASSLGTTITTIRYALNGYMVKHFVIVGVICGLLGSYCGSNLALITNDFIFKMIMLVAIGPIAFFVFKTRDLDEFSHDQLPKRKAMVLTAVIALTIGVYDGFYGPGTGTFLMLLLTSVAHQTLACAAGTTKAINLSTNLAALAVFLVNGVVLLPLGLAAGAFNIAGNWIGAHFFTKKGSAITRPVMIVVLALFAVRLVYDLLGG